MLAKPRPSTRSSTDPVTFAGDDAVRFANELPKSLEPAVAERLRSSAAAGAAATSTRPANDFFR